ncbi:uncharacterized protein METZ01_LOCUS487002 [marine metagenome]|uniref:Uncharacterized protein n=1 Tax=marine metagenome TaxID=408172 RepID=A0A383CRA4_9ZZZZ
MQKNENIFPKQEKLTDDPIYIANSLNPNYFFAAF